MPIAEHIYRVICWCMLDSVYLSVLLLLCDSADISQTRSVMFCQSRRLSNPFVTDGTIIGATFSTICLT